MKSKSASTAKSRLRAILDRQHTQTMDLDFLLAWLDDHRDSMIPNDDNASHQFVRRFRDIHEGSIPDYLLRSIDPDSIRSGIRDGLTHVTFTYLRGGTVLLYPCEAPTEQDYEEMANHFSRVEYETHVYRMQVYVPY